MSYSAFARLARMPVTQPTIGCDRCVWVSTVLAPLPIDGPSGYKGPASAPSYTVATDQASGAVIDVIAAAVLSATTLGTGTTSPPQS